MVNRVDANKIQNLLSSRFYIRNATTTIRWDGIVDVHSEDNMGVVDLEVGPTIPVRFGEFKASFSASNQRLKSLRNSPQVVATDFKIDECDLTSLKGGPMEVGRTYNCGRNPITSLAGSPKNVEYAFDCSETNITTLEGCPQNAMRWLRADGCKLTDLSGAPPELGSLIVTNNPLKSLDGLPRIIHKAIYITWQPNLPLLRLLGSTIARITFGGPNGPETHKEISAILHKNMEFYRVSRNRAIMTAQKELVNLGYQGNALW